MSSKERVTSNLVALGVAAVFTVYAAGYARTQPAAQRLADEEAGERRPPPLVRPAAPTTVTPVAPPRSPSTASTPVAPPPSRRATPASEPPTPPPAPVGTTAAVPAVSAPARIDSASAPIVASPSTTPVPMPAPLPAPLPVRDSSKAATVAPQTDSAAKPASTEAVHYKDGIFFGWGTSRHGDIQMGIEIKDGRIKSAFISECNTQYDCSWITHLPKQVVERQSADVDFVSGATQSATALYRAVVNALKQAK